MHTLCTLPSQLRSWVTARMRSWSRTGARKENLLFPSGLSADEKKRLDGVPEAHSLRTRRVCIACDSPCTTLYISDFRCFGRVGAERRSLSPLLAATLDDFGSLAGFRGVKALPRAIHTRQPKLTTPRDDTAYRRFGDLPTTRQQQRTPA